MAWLRAGSSSAFTVTIIVLGVGVLVLWYSGGTPVDVTPVEAEEVPPPGQSVGFGESGGSAPVVVSVPDTSHEGEIGPPRVSSESEDSAPHVSPVARPRSSSQWQDSDTGPFIDAEDDAGDYSFSPVSDIGEFLDPDAD